MEDVVIVEIFCLQVWQWVVLLKGIFDDGCKVIEEMVCLMIVEELVKVKVIVIVQGEDMVIYDQVVVIFDKMLLIVEYLEFLILLLYEVME